MHKAAKGVIGEALILRVLRERRDRLLVQAEVEDRLHHPRHGPRRAGAHAHKQRIIGVAQALAGNFFKALQVGVNLRAQLRWDIYDRA